MRPAPTARQTCVRPGRVRPGRTLSCWLAVLDQRQFAAAIVVDTGCPQLAVHVGDAAEDVAAAAWVGGRVYAPGAVGPLENQVVIVVGRRVHVSPDRPHAASGYRDPPEVGPVGAVGGGGQLSDRPGPVLVALDQWLAAALRAATLSRHPDLAGRSGDAIKHHPRSRSWRRHRHDRPLLAVPVLD